jgi:hypothetical protein
LAIVRLREWSVMQMNALPRAAAAALMAAMSTASRAEEGCELILMPWMHLIP